MEVTNSNSDGISPISHSMMENPMANGLTGAGVSGLQVKENLFFENLKQGESSYSLPVCEVPLVRPDHATAKTSPAEDLGMSELDVIRHFSRLSTWNFSIELGMYPLGSCTMKYNPRINEEVAAMGDFRQAHPYADETDLQGCFEVTLSGVQWRCAGW